jgi:hypothetical protein
MPKMLKGCSPKKQWSHVTRSFFGHPNKAIIHCSCAQLKL